MITDNIVGKTDELRGLVQAKAGEAGTASMLIDRGAFSITRLGPQSFTVTMEARTRGGLRVPFQSSFYGKLPTKRACAKLAGAFIESLIELKKRAYGHERRKAELEAAIRSYIASASEAGVTLGLVQIVERPIDPEYPNGAEHMLYFDVTMTMLNDEDLKMDCYTMDAADADEFVSYLQSSIVPEQEALIERMRSAQSIPAPANAA